MTLHIADGLDLPDDLVTKTVGILAQRRKGKTYTASVIAEEMVAAGIPWVALDPTGAWWGLRASADGKSDGLPVTIIGGQHGDVPLERTAGDELANFVVDEPGWYVLDLSLFESKAADRQFATAFAERLYRRKGQPGGDMPMHLFVDEADIFVPQTAGQDGKTMLGAYETLVRRGGIRGLGTTLISQRSAVVNKNVLEMCDLMIVLRTVGPNDRQRIHDIVTAAGTAAQVAELDASIASLDVGEAWFWEPGEALFERRHVRERHTFNSSSTPKQGETRVEPRKLADVDLDALKDRMAATIEKAQADDPKLLHARIRELKRELGVARAQKPEPERIEVLIEVPVVPPRISLLSHAAHETLGKYGDALEVLHTLHDALTESLAQIGAEIRDADAVPTPPTSHNTKPTSLSSAPDAARAPHTSGTSHRQRRTPAAPATTSAVDVRLGKAERAILATLITYGPRTRTVLAFLAGYSQKSSGYANALGKLRSLGLITPSGDPIAATDDGLVFLAGQVDPPPSAAQVYALIMGRLGKAERAILQAALDALPAVLDRDELAAQASYSPTSSGYANALGRLRSLELLDGLAPTDELIEAIR